MRYVAEEEYRSSEEEYAYTVNSPSEKGEINNLVENEPISVIIDSGASVKILNTNAAEILLKKGIKFEVCRKTIYPYGSPLITVKHKLKAKIQLGKARAHSHAY